MSARSASASEMSGPSSAPRMASVVRSSRGTPRAPCETASAAPSAPPASPAAGWIHTSSNGPSRTIRPFATQLSATPPARHNDAAPVCSCARAASLSMASSTTSWTDAARSISRWVSGPSGARGGPPNKCAKRRPVIVSPQG